MRLDPDRKASHDRNVSIISASELMIRLIVALIVALCPLFGSADSWAAAAVQARSSERGNFVVRVVPGTSKGDVYGFAGAPKGPYATAEWYKHDGSGYQKLQTVTLLNPVAPMDIEVTEKGNLITIDNWHNQGYGFVLVIYSPDGQVVKKYRLLDLYAESDIKRMKITTSSIHWRCNGFSGMLETPMELWIEDSLGGRFRVNVETGSFRYDRSGGSCGK